jgi:hypothetical protein
MDAKSQALGLSRFFVLSRTRFPARMRRSRRFDRILRKITQAGEIAGIGTGVW